MLRAPLLATHPDPRAGTGTCPYKAGGCTRAPRLASLPLSPFPFPLTFPPPYFPSFSRQPGSTSGFWPSGSGSTSRAYRSGRRALM